MVELLRGSSNRGELNVAYKLVALIDNHLSLGSILVTKGVHVISIETVSDGQIKDENILIPRKVIRDQNEKNTKEVVLDYLQRNSQATWGELRKLMSENGYAKTSVNNAITRLMKENKVIKVSHGTYALNAKEKISA